MPECRNCDGFVTSEYARVFGTNDDEVFACRGCAGMGEILDGATVRPPQS